MGRVIENTKPSPELIQLSRQGRNELAPDFMGPPTLRAFANQWSKFDEAAVSNGVVVGNLQIHSQGRLMQSHGALSLIEGLREAGRLPPGTEISVKKAHAQDMRGSDEHQAAHRIPGDIVVKTPDGKVTRLANMFRAPGVKAEVDRVIFAPTDNMHRLANLADRWMESGGMLKTLERAANAVAKGMPAQDATRNIIEPGYQKAINKSHKNIDRNLDLARRNAMALAFKRAGVAPASMKDASKLALNATDPNVRIATREMLVTVYEGYAKHTKLPPNVEQGMNVVTRQILNNEKIQARVEARNAPVAAKTITAPTASAPKPAVPQISAPKVAAPAKAASIKLAR